jgi:hypothetical protein
MNTQEPVTKKLRALLLLLFALFHAQGQKALGSNYWRLPADVRATTSDPKSNILSNSLKMFYPHFNRQPLSTMQYSHAK